MMLGFWLASRLPVWLTVALAVGAEVVTTLLIRDGLTLNVHDAALAGRGDPGLAGGRLRPAAR